MPIESIEYANKLDEEFPGFSDEFVVPTSKSLGSIQEPEVPSIYFIGNSLGLMPKTTAPAVNQELQAWGMRGVEAHFRHPFSEDWVTKDRPVAELLVPILGAESVHEVAPMNSLTVNLHSMLLTFYKPTSKRFKILYEAKAFPSDLYAFQSQAKLHGYDSNEALVGLEPREGEFTLRTEDIVEAIEKEGSSLAVVLFSGIQYYTGQFFDIPAITEAGKKVGAVVGWDLAHAVGNVPLKLHDWNVDFAVFCSYKYLNAGPGSIGGIFVNSKYSKDSRDRLAGWWGNNEETRFEMNAKFDPIPGANGFRLSNPSVLNLVCLEQSLLIFKAHGGIDKLRLRSLSLTNYLYDLLVQSEFYSNSSTSDSPAFTIITPADPKSRGAQLSLLFLPQGSGVMQKVFKELESNFILGDQRAPDVIRLSPNHFYNTHLEVLTVVKTLNKLFATLKV